MAIPTDAPAKPSDAAIYAAWDALEAALLPALISLDPAVLAWLAENAEPGAWLRNVADSALDAQAG